MLAVSSATSCTSSDCHFVIEPAFFLENCHHMTVMCHHVRNTWHFLYVRTSATRTQQYRPEKRSEKVWKMAAKAYVVSMTVTELKEELKQRGLSTKGSKKSLRDRLEQVGFEND